MDWKVCVLNVLLLYYVTVSSHTRHSARMHEYEVTALVLGLVYSERLKYKFIKFENMLGNIIILVITMKNQNINKDTDGL